MRARFVEPADDENAPQAKQTGGEAYVEFEALFSEVVSAELPIKITVTPRGKWSGMYVVESSASGFIVKAGAGATDAEFDWTAIGRTRGHEIRRSVKLITQEEIEAATNRYRAQAEAKRDASGKMPKRATFPANKM
jgi:hypothetical protein